ncbi:MAG: hypothetical protein KJO10_11230 [Gammaproteobacteria bacterium]|nr:hypothetical protein [Gammaproteobacteria bacterium]
MANRLALTIPRHCAERCHTQQATDHGVLMAACAGVDALEFAAKPGVSRALASVDMTIWKKSRRSGNSTGFLTNHTG